MVTRTDAICYQGIGIYGTALATAGDTTIDIIPKMNTKSAFRQMVVLVCATLDIIRTSNA